MPSHLSQDGFYQESKGHQMLTREREGEALAQGGAATVEVSVEVSQRAKPSTTVSQIYYLGI